MEYIDGWRLDSDFTRELSADRQIAMVRPLTQLPHMNE